jgi:hypothetical protein
MFLVSRKFHNSFGIPGTEVTGTDSQRMAAARKGWEWYINLTKNSVTGIQDANTCLGGLLLFGN